MSTRLSVGRIVEPRQSTKVRTALRSGPSGLGRNMERPAARPPHFHLLAGSMDRLAAHHESKSAASPADAQHSRIWEHRSAVQSPSRWVVDHRGRPLAHLGGRRVLFAHSSGISLHSRKESDLIDHGTISSLSDFRSVSRHVDRLCQVRVHVNVEHAPILRIPGALASLLVRSVILPGGSGELHKA